MERSSSFGLGVLTCATVPEGAVAKTDSVAEDVTTAEKLVTSAAHFDVVMVTQQSSDEKAIDIAN